MIRRAAFWLPVFAVLAGCAESAEPAGLPCDICDHLDWLKQTL